MFRIAGFFLIGFVATLTAVDNLPQTERESATLTMAERAGTGHLKVYARSGDKVTLAWVVRNDWWRALVMEGKRPETVTGAIPNLPGRAAGEYQVQCIDPWTGRLMEKRRIRIPAG